MRHPVDPKALFRRVFPTLARNRRELFGAFRNVSGFMLGYLASIPDVPTRAVGPGLFVDGRGRPTPAFLAYAETYYPSEAVRLSQLSRVRTLARAERESAEAHQGAGGLGLSPASPSGADGALPSAGRMPPKIDLQLRTFCERARYGMEAYPELLGLAHETGCYNTGPLSPLAVESHRRHFIRTVAHMQLDEDAEVADLLKLDFHVGNNVISGRNPHMDRLREAESAAERPGFKRAGYDSVAFARGVSAVCAVARFNGEFVLPAEFRKHYPIKLDRRSRAERRHMKKLKLNSRFVDSEISRLKGEFDTILCRRSYLTDRHDLRLCLFLPELVTARYLGLRGGDMRECRVGTNILFGPKGSVRFRFSNDELRPHKARDFTLSLENHGDIEEVHLLLSVLTDYKHRFLDVLRSEDPTHYTEMMQDYFFGRAAREKGLIEAHAGRSSSEGRPDLSPGNIGKRFMSDADALMRVDGEGGESSVVSLEAVRQLAHRWMYEVLNLPVEEIARFSGYTLECAIRALGRARPKSQGGQH